jgi:hypothetical protein
MYQHQNSKHRYEFILMWPCKCHGFPDFFVLCNALCKDCKNTSLTFKISVLGKNTVTTRHESASGQIQMVFSAKSWKDFCLADNVEWTHFIIFSVTTAWSKVYGLIPLTFNPSEFSFQAVLCEMDTKNKVRDRKFFHIFPLIFREEWFFTLSTQEERKKYTVTGYYRGHRRNL